MASDKQGKSRRLGRATLDDGATTTAYRALTEHTCGQCQRPIAPDEVFSRRTARFVAGPGMMQLTRQPVCTTCRPVRLGTAAGGAGGAAPPWEGDHE